MTRLQAALLVIVFSRAILGAEVKDAGPEGFNIGFTLNVHAKPDDVYRKLVDEVLKGQFERLKHLIETGSPE